MKNWVVFLLVGMLMEGLCTARAAEGRAVANTILAIVGDTVVTREQVRMIVRKNTGYDESSFYRLFPNDTPEVARAKFMRLMEEAYESLIVRQLVLQEYKNLEKKGAKVPESVIDEYLRREIAGDRVQFARELEQQGKSFEQYRTDLREKIIFDAMKVQFVPDPIISPNKIEAYYHAHPEKYRMEERVKLRTIYLMKPEGDGAPAVRGRMEDLATLLKTGTDFKELEKSYSDVRSREDTAEPAWRDVTSLDESIRSDLAKLKPGECSGVIEMPNRYVILRLEERDPGHALPLKDVRESIEKTLKDEESNRRLNEWFRRLESRILVRKF